MGDLRGIQIIHSEFRGRLQGVGLGDHRLWGLGGGGRLWRRNSIHTIILVIGVGIDHSRCIIHTRRRWGSLMRNWQLLLLVMLIIC